MSPLPLWYSTWSLFMDPESSFSFFCMVVSNRWWTKSLHKEMVGNHHFHPWKQWLAISGTRHVLISAKISEFVFVVADFWIWRTQKASGHGNALHGPTSWRHWTKTRWWFQTVFIFTPNFGEDFFPFWLLHIFQMGWNHQLENVWWKNPKPFRERVESSLEWYITCSMSFCWNLDEVFTLKASLNEIYLEVQDT